MNSREQRKNDHIKYAMLLKDGPQTTCFEGVHFMHDCLPELDLKSIDISSKIGSIKLSHPLIINAITGGNDDVVSVNKNLAEIAQKTNTAMAVGSQYGAIKNNKGLASYEIIRKVNPKGIVFANVSALATVEEAKTAVKMIAADGLQIHLNVAQEIAMLEGDTNFTGYKANIEKIVNALDVPVIVKETGCGMGREAIAELLDLGVKIIDISGAGGTNFPAIEAARSQDSKTDLLNWGIPTAVSLLEASSHKAKNLSVIASGGIRTPLDCVKAFGLGASAVAMAGNMLSYAKDNKVKEGITFIEDFNLALKEIMLLTGANKISKLSQKQMYFTGEMFQILTSLGYDLTKISKNR